jgi:hypothetical protein
MTDSRELVPADEERLAHFMATARMIPPHLQKSTADCLLVIRQAIRWHMDPFAVAQECSSIQGKVMYGGKLVAAVINTHANLKEHLSYRYHGKGDARAVTVSGHIEGEEQPRTIRVALKDAKTTNKVWQTQPDQQLAYHGARVWARRHAPELMLGVYSPEEFPQPAPKIEAIVKPEYDDTIPNFEDEDSAPGPTMQLPEAGPPAPPAQDSAPPGQGGAGESVLKIAEIKARQGRDALMAYTENLTVEDRRIVAAKIDHLKALYPK